jgi:hypothetical protein
MEELPQPVSSSLWIRKTKDHPGLSLAEATQSNYRLENKGSNLANGNRQNQTTTLDHQKIPRQEENST